MTRERERERESDLTVRRAGVDLTERAAVTPTEVMLRLLYLLRHLLAVDRLVGQQAPDLPFRGQYVSPSVHLPPLTPSVEEQHDDQQPEQKEEDHQHQVLDTDVVHVVPGGLCGGGEDQAGGLYPGHVVAGPRHSPQHDLVAGEGLEAGQLDGGGERVLDLNKVLR